MTISISFDMPLPATEETPTPDQIQEWVEYQLGYRGSMSMENPLSDCDLDNADNISIS